MKRIEMFSIWQNKMKPDSAQTCEVWFAGESESVSMSYQALKPCLEGLNVELVMQEPSPDGNDTLFTYKVLFPENC